MGPDALGSRCHAWHHPSACSYRIDSKHHQCARLIGWGGRHGSGRGWLLQYDWLERASSGTSPQADGSFRVARARKSVTLLCNSARLTRRIFGVIWLRRSGLTRQGDGSRQGGSFVITPSTQTPPGCTSHPRRGYPDVGGVAITTLACCAWTRALSYGGGMLLGLKAGGKEEEARYRTALIS